MLKIDYVSDLHLNHHVPFSHDQKKWRRKTKAWTEKLMETASVEVLIVAGDFSEWKLLDERHRVSGRGAERFAKVFHHSFSSTNRCYFCKVSFYNKKWTRAM